MLDYGKVIVLANKSLDIIEAKSSLLTANQKDQFQAEVRALRALMYYEAMDMFGRIPVVLSSGEAALYASDAVSAAIFANICEAAGVPCQRFVNHSDVAGGSTLGNILASSIPLKGVDMGNAILAMHSCR